MPAASCPNCRSPMQPLALAGTVKAVEIDACYACHAFWFDAMESPGLADASVLELFKRIHEHRDTIRHSLKARLACPRCKSELVRTQDLQRSNRIEYHRCPHGCGRLTTFFQFLREKNFVRSLTKAEMTQLRVQVSQVRCSSCGAVVAVEKDAACKHCGAPVSILDADAVEKRLVELKSGRPRVPEPPPHSKPAGARREPFEWRPRHGRAGSQPGGVYDLVDDAISGLSGWFDH